MIGLPKLTAVELKLFLRDRVSLSFVLLWPSGILLLFGLIYGDAMTFLASLTVSISLGMVGLFTVPSYLSRDREVGILRRLSTTPVHPVMLLIAQLVIHLAMAVVSVILVIGVGHLVLAIALPKNLVGFFAALILGMAALISVGLLIAAVAPNSRAASAIGPLVFWASLFFAGVWLPRDRMPDLLGRISDYTPLGATREMLEASWAGGAPQPLQLVAMALITVVIGATAARLFRWE
ncbi:MAG TPA: ABC transporter permease [Ktedonobacterales bacterium]